MDSIEFHGIHGIPWIPWNSMESMEFYGIHGIPWNPWNSMESTMEFMDSMDSMISHGFHHGIASMNTRRLFKKCHDMQWNSMEFQRIPWYSIYGMPWKSKQSNGIPWNFNEIPWKSWIPWISWVSQFQLLVPDPWIPWNSGFQFPACIPRTSLDSLRVGMATEINEHQLVCTHRHP